jgi:hypothetical protein
MIRASSRATLSSIRAHGTVRCAVSALDHARCTRPEPRADGGGPAAGGPPASRSSSRTRGVRTRGRSTGMSCRLSGRSRWPLLMPTCSTRSMPSCATAVTIATASGTCGSPDSVGARCDGRCRPHTCVGLPASTIRQIPFHLERCVAACGVLAGSRRIRSIRRTRRPRQGRILAAGPGAGGAHHHRRAWMNPDWGTLVRLTTVSGLRRGELCSNGCSLRPPPAAALARRHGQLPDRPGRRRALALAWPRAPAPPDLRFAGHSAQRINAQVASPSARSLAATWPSVQVSVATHDRAASAAHVVDPPKRQLASEERTDDEHQ